MSMHRKEKNIKGNELQKMTLINNREDNLMSIQQQHNCFKKMRYASQ